FSPAEDGIRDFHVTGVQTCALPILAASTPLFTRIDPKLIDAMTEASKDTLAAAPATAQPGKKAEAKKEAAPAAPATDAPQHVGKIGRASCRESGENGGGPGVLGETL